MFLITLMSLILLASQEFVSAIPPERPLPDASWNHLPRWRGFNLLEKFNASQSGPFHEEDFRWIAELGFNYVRLPMDYRCWIVDGDWRRLREEPLKEIDQAVEYGRRYRIHVTLNFHRAPGFTVAHPPEAKSLWTDAEAQEVCALHWRTFAKRYKGIPNRNLSFNLLNEPPALDPALHAAVIAKLVAAIRAEDPQRLIICDSRQWGTVPCNELVPLKVAQSTRGYTPMEVTHYKAPWVKMNDSTPPSWPILDASGWLAGPAKSDQGGPLLINGPFLNVTTLRLHVLEVSTRSKLTVQADGKTIFEHLFQCGPGNGEWKKASFQPQWQTYQNLYDRDYEVKIPAGTKRITLDNTDGDWLTLSEIGLIHDDGHEQIARLLPAYGQKPDAINFMPGAQAPFQVNGLSGRQWLSEKCIEPFRPLQAQRVGIMVGEFGAFNKTPHPIVLSWMHDNLANWQNAGWGWALWNFRGSFGILDSGRADISYEDFHGHKLDRKMLELLQKF